MNIENLITKLSALRSRCYDEHWLVSAIAVNETIKLLEEGTVIYGNPDAVYESWTAERTGVDTRQALFINPQSISKEEPDSAEKILEDLVQAMAPMSDVWSHKFSEIEERAKKVLADK